MKKALIVVALVQNHYLKVIQSLMHTVVGLTIQFLEKFLDRHMEWKRTCAA
jgi:hypothetical protein